MKQTVALRFGQSLTMTPALQQAIRLLQLSTLDLQQEIQQVLDSNLMLERQDEVPVADVPDPNDAAPAEQAAEATATDTIPEDLPVDAEWDDIYETEAYTRSGEDDEEYREYREANRHRPTSLHEHLIWQAGVYPFSPEQAEIAAHIIDAINEDGYVEEWDSLALRLAALPGATTEAIAQVLGIVQDFDPPGVAARNLAECLGLQLNQLNAETPGLALARRLIVPEYMELLAAHDNAALQRRLQTQEAPLQEAVRLLQSLQPHPGSPFSNHEAEYVVPEIFVTKKHNRWVVSLNPDITPKLRINPEYMRLIRRADQSTDQQTLKQHLQEARYFLNSLKSRNETLLRVSQCIVEEQRAFLEYGEEAMKPLVLRDVAAQVGVHESTVSRAIANKFMHSPRGLYELKYFFSSHVQTTTGGTCSATAIQAMIRRLVSQESPRNPLSDSAIVDLLLKEGIQIARRTVAKYREEMDIAPSHERKRTA